MVADTFTVFLDLLGVKYTGSFSSEYFNEHPHKYNLYGLSKMLSDYGVENAVIRVAGKEQALPDIKIPFIALFGGDGVSSKITSCKVAGSDILPLYIFERRT